MSLAEIKYCMNCSEVLTKVSEMPDDRRYIHSRTEALVCDLPKDTNGYAYNAIPGPSRNGTIRPSTSNDLIEEPSYMMFARANVRGGISSSARVVSALLVRIDRLEREANEQNK